MMPKFPGNLCLMRLGSRTLHTAIDNPNRIVPKKRVPIPAMERSRVPAVRTINDDSKTISVPKRRDNKGTNGDRHAKAKSGTVVMVPAAALVMPRLSRIEETSGPTDVRGALRLAPINMTPMTSNISFYADLLAELDVRL